MLGVTDSCSAGAGWSAIALTELRDEPNLVGLVSTVVTAWDGTTFGGTALFRTVTSAVAATPKTKTPNTAHLAATEVTTAMALPLAPTAVEVTLTRALVALSAKTARSIARLRGCSARPARNILAMSEGISSSSQRLS
jgi:hypothetical protein